MCECTHACACVCVEGRPWNCRLSSRWWRDSLSQMRVTVLGVSLPVIPKCGCRGLASTRPTGSPAESGRGSDWGSSLHPPQEAALQEGRLAGLSVSPGKSGVAERPSRRAWGQGWAAVGSAGWARTGRLSLLCAVFPESRCRGRRPLPRAVSHQSGLTWEPSSAGASNPHVGGKEAEWWESGGSILGFPGEELARVGQGLTRGS